jgi:hypothetical protein
MEAPYSADMELKYDSEAIVQLNSLEPEHPATEFLMFLYRLKITPKG